MDSGYSHIHNVKFYDIKPRSIITMACNHVQKKLALARFDGSIEIWDIRNAPCLEQILSDKVTSKGVKALGWCRDRLFSASTAGDLIEWDLRTLSVRFKAYVTGTIIYCLDVNRQQTELALGTEEGYITIFDISNDELVYAQTFDKQQDRILCCCFDATGDFLVTGSLGVIRVWNRKGHAIHRIKVGRQWNKLHTKALIIWSLQVLNDFTIIAGDSRGWITMWDGNTAACLEMHHILKADILAVAVNEEQNKLFCAGVEPTICMYVKTQIERDDLQFNKWVKYLQRRVHDHHVKTLICLNDTIYSGGVGGYLGVSSNLKIPNRPTAKHGPFLQKPCAAVSHDERLLLLRYICYLQVWRLGQPSNYDKNTFNKKSDPINTTTNETTNCLPLKELPEKLLEIRSKNKEMIVCSALSPDGYWLCYSTQSYIRLFHFISKNANNSQSQLVRMNDLPEQFEPASHIMFSRDSSRLFLVNRQSKQIVIFACLSNQYFHTELHNDSSTLPPLDFIETIDTSKHLKHAVKLCELTECGQYLVAASLDHSIAVWSIHKGKHFKYLLNLPRYTAAVTTAIALHAKQPRLVVAYADGKIIEYDLEEMCFTCSALENYFPGCTSHPITSICLDKRNPNVFIMQNENNIFVLKKYKKKEDMENQQLENGTNGMPLKKFKNPTSKENDNESTDIAGLRLGMHKTMEHVLQLMWLSSHELVAVCVDRIALYDHLPEPYDYKRFATM